MSLHEGYFPSMKELKLDRQAAEQFATDAEKETEKQHNKHVLFGRNVISPTMGSYGDSDLGASLRNRYRELNSQLQQQAKYLEDTSNKFKLLEYQSKEVSETEMTEYMASRVAFDNDRQKLSELDALIERGFGFEDVNDDNYHRALYNPDTFSFWFPRLLSAAKTQDFFKIPATKYLTLPQSIMQYLHHDWSAETNRKSRSALNKLLFDTFELDVHKEYFFKTGLFSGKFEFQNAHIDDPAAIGDYLHVVSNEAQMVGAAASNDMVVREWIPDPENRPTIYDGMPLRTEFRAFIDADLHHVIDVVPYWNNKKVEDTLNMMHRTHIGNQNMEQDAKAYIKAKPILDREFAENKSLVMAKLQDVVDKLALSGCWSLDVMKSGDDFYLIDMATMATSALTDTADKEALLNDMLLRKSKKLPAQMPFETNWKFADDPETIMDAYDKLPQPADLKKLED
jgi:hypothetical protein